MSYNQIFFNKTKALQVDKFLENVLYKKKGYYSSNIPFGSKGDFITAPGVSNLFSEIIGIWMISSWHILGEPNKFNIVELGPGDGSLTKILIRTFKKFPSFKKSVNIFLYEKSGLLKKLQKKNINNIQVKWINDFDDIKEGPVIFFGNEFFDAIPIKQFIKKKKSYLEKYFSINNQNKIIKLYKKAKNKDITQLKKYKSIKNLKFIEFPKKGLKVIDKIVNKVSELKGGLLLVDYGYLISNNKSTLQSVFKHKKNNLLENLGKADITSLVNFELLKEHLIKKKLKVKNIVSQKFFLENMGIINRADNLSKKMSFREQTNLYLRLKRLLDKKFMGDLFKVIFAYKFHKNNFLGFE